MVNILDRSSLKTKSNLPYLQIPELEKLGWLRHAFMTRQGGVSLPPYHSLNMGRRNGDRQEDVLSNTHRIAAALHFKPDQLILLRQMQEDQVLSLKKPLLAPPSDAECDASMTDVPNTFLGILTADCIPILVVDKRKRVVSAIHAGRQGTALGITSKALRKMVTEFGCAIGDLIIALGPAIGACCYEIDERVFQSAWEPYSKPNGEGRWLVDLARINIEEMKKQGIREDQISWLKLCTSCHSDLFFSYRKEGQTGRQLSLIGIMK